jgi:Cu2+-exporting ATPase
MPEFTLFYDLSSLELTVHMEATCQHCGTPYRPREGTGVFCCSGCEQVYRLIRDEGLDEYYHLQDRVGRPLRESPFARNDLPWAPALQAEAEAVGAGSPAELRLRVGGMSCLGCVWLIERLARRSPGVHSARVQLEAHSMHLSWRAGALDLHALAQELQRFGYHVEPFTGAISQPVSALAWRVLLCAVFTGNSLLLAIPQLMELDAFVYVDLFFLLSLLFAGLSFAVGGALLILSAWRALWRLRFSFDVLAGATVICFLLLAVVVPLFHSGMELQPWKFSACVFLLLLGQWLRRTWLNKRGTPNH